MTYLGVPMREDELLTAVLDLAQAAGWRCFHPRPARTQGGWRTATQGDNGWPDLALAGHGRFLLVELKRTGGALTDDQARWRHDLEAAGVEYHLWRPLDWLDGTIAKVLGCEAHTIVRR